MVKPWDEVAKIIIRTLTFFYLPHFPQLPVSEKLDGFYFIIDVCSYQQVFAIELAV